MGRNNARRTWDITDEKKLLQRSWNIYDEKKLAQRTWNIAGEKQLVQRSWDIADDKKITQRTWNVADEKKLAQSIRGSYGKVSDVADKFSQLKVNSVQQNLPRPLLPGSFHGRTDFLDRSHENPYGRSYSRKVAG